MPSIFSAPSQKYKVYWNKECKLALLQFKKYLIEPPLLFTPNERQLLYVYLTIFEHIISLVLLREVDEEQCPIYFISKIFTDYQIRYLLLEKRVLALVLTSWKLMHYFQAYLIVAYTEFQLKNIVPKANLSGRLSKWAIELG